MVGRAVEELVAQGRDRRREGCWFAALTCVACSPSGAARIADRECLGSFGAVVALRVERFEGLRLSDPAGRRRRRSAAAPGPAPRSGPRRRSPPATRLRRRSSPPPAAAPRSSRGRPRVPRRRPSRPVRSRRPGSCCWSRRPDSRVLPPPPRSASAFPRSPWGEPPAPAPACSSPCSSRRPRGQRRRGRRSRRRSGRRTPSTRRGSVCGAVWRALAPEARPASASAPPWASPAHPMAGSRR